MRKTLILITNEFPYGYGEPYLDSELPFLAERFAEIIITPIHVNISEVRKVPENVSICSYSSKKELISSWSTIKFHRIALIEFTKEIFGYFNFYGILPRRSMYFQLTEFLRKGAQIKSFINTLLKDKECVTNETVIYSYWAAHAAVAAAMLKKDLPDLFVVSRAHGWDVYFERIITKYIPLRPYILKKIDRLYPVSAQGAYYLNIKLGFKFQDKIEARNLGVELPVIEVSIKKKCAELHLVSCARLVDLKRIDLIIEALKELRNRSLLPTVHWTHLGGGPLFNPLKKDVEEALAGQSQFTFDFRGDLTNKEVLNFYKNYNVDLFVSTSEWEGLPVSIMEAASFSIPIIATDVGGVSEIVCDGRNGWLVPKALTGFKLADKIENWVQLPEDEKQQFRSQSRRIAEERFCAQKNFRDWTDEIIS